MSFLKRAGIFKTLKDFSKNRERLASHLDAVLDKSKGTLLSQKELVDVSEVS